MKTEFNEGKLIKIGPSRFAIATQSQEREDGTYYFLVETNGTVLGWTKIEMKKIVLMRFAQLATGLLDLISHLSSDTVMIELGSYAGESSAMFAEKVKKIYCVDLWDDLTKIGLESDISLETREKPQDYEARFDLVVSQHPNIVKCKGSIDDWIGKFDRESFDAGYIDADHTYPSVLKNTKQLLPLIKPGGYIGGHDYCPSLWPGVVQAVNEMFDPSKLKVFDDTSWLIVKE